MNTGVRKELRLSVGQRIANGLLTCLSMPGAYWAIVAFLRYGIGLRPIPDWMLLCGLLITAYCLVRGIIKAKSESWFSVRYIVDAESIEERRLSGEVNRAQWASLQSVSGPHANLTTLVGFIQVGLRDLTGYGKPIALSFSDGTVIEVPRTGIPAIAYNAFITPMVDICNEDSPLHQYVVNHARFASAQQLLAPARERIYLVSLSLGMILTSILLLVVARELRTLSVALLVAGILLLFTVLFSTGRKSSNRS